MKLLHHGFDSGVSQFQAVPLTHDIYIQPNKSNINFSQQASHSLESHKELVEWVGKQGGYIADSVRVAQDAQRGVHLQVKTDWPSTVSKETRVINTPLGVTMSYFNAINYQSSKGTFPSRDVDFPRAFIDAVGPEETTTFFLMGQFLLGPRSFWYPYLRTLPQPGQLTTPLFFGEEDVDWIYGTGIQEAAVQRYQAWDEKFDASIAKLEELGFEGVEVFTMYGLIYDFDGSCVADFLGICISGPRQLLLRGHSRQRFFPRPWRTRISRMMEYRSCYR